jgi:hypothetical protein
MRAGLNRHAERFSEPGGEHAGGSFSLIPNRFLALCMGLVGVSILTAQEIL